MVALGVPPGACCTGLVAEVVELRSDVIGNLLH